jgi:hypothetical protein
VLTRKSLRSYSVGVVQRHYVQRSIAATCSRRDVAQFGSAPALGAGGRRFKSSHPDMQTIIAVGLITLATEVVLFVLLIRHVKSITKLFSQYNDSSVKEMEVEDKIGIYQEKIIELEDRNKKVELENKLLQEKIAKINKQMKQISDHFKPN